jgi:CheY-like chemotaxis protein
VQRNSLRMSKTVFVVEDDAEFRRMLSFLFQAAGYDVEEAADGTACLERLQRPDPPDLVVCDVRIPGIDGLEVFRRLRDQERHVPPFVIITGFGDADVHDRGAMLGALATMDKPFDLDELQRLVTIHFSGET